MQKIRIKYKINNKLQGYDLEKFKDVTNLLQLFKVYNLKKI
jgi:hypothetical protein